ncbi:MAG: DUF2332 domain-containing protein [Acetobacteraceae bacterium]|nr:DUF2332 domain-containing protein [Acetobacteraceae bacterium]
MSDVIARRFRRFADLEAKGHSALYEALAVGVSEDRAILDFLSELPEAKQQPNLLLAALRFVCGTPTDWPDFVAGFHERKSEIRDRILRCRTQTNEPARCAVLLPVFAQPRRDLALIEAGASAGLCLLPDRYGYHYDGHAPFGPEPRFPCRATAATPVPAAHPSVVWRAGLDLNPLDARNADDMAWLEALVWPDQPSRIQRLRAAIAVAQADPPRLVMGNLLTDLPALAAEAPRDAALVIYHTAVLAYVADPAARARFVRTVTDLNAIWISNEVPGVFPEIAAKVSVARPTGAFLLAVNGEPVAWTDPHGAWIDWFADPCILPP